MRQTQSKVHRQLAAQEDDDLTFPLHGQGQELCPPEFASDRFRASRVRANNYLTAQELTTMPVKIAESVTASPRMANGCNLHGMILRV
jgi:hypothetical protein